VARDSRGCLLPDVGLIEHVLGFSVDAIHPHVAGPQAVAYAMTQNQRVGLSQSFTDEQ